MNAQRMLAPTILCLLAVLPRLHSAEATADLKQIQSAAKIHGGLCLALGADPACAAELAREFGAYVQLIAPDAETAVQWLKTAQDFAERQNISAVHHGHQAWPYARDLVNLIVIKGATAVPPAEELKRILAPGGVLALQGIPADSAAALEKAGLQRLPASGWILLQKPKLGSVEDWGSKFGSPQMGNSAPYSTIEPTMGLRWRAGPRWNNRASAYDCMVCGDGVLIYREINLVPGKVKLFQRAVVGRDAYNGRELWRINESPMPPPTYGFSPTTLLTTGEGRTLIELDGKPTCIDTHTGKVLYVLPRPGNQPARFASIHQGHILCAGGNGTLSVHALEDGRVLWSAVISAHAMAAARGDTVYAAADDKAGGAIMAWSLAKGEVVWKHPVADDPAAEGARFGNYVFCSGGGVHYQKYTRERIYLQCLDFKSGKHLWTSEAENPKTVFPESKDMSESLYMTAFEKEIWYQFKKGEKVGYTVHMTAIDANTGKTLKKNYSMHNGDTHCWKLKGAGNYLLYSKNQFVKREDMSVSANGLVRSICDIGHIPASRQIFLLPHNCRCSTLIRGIVSMGAPESGIAFNPQPVLVPFKQAPATDGAADWPMYRRDPVRSNAIPFSIGKKLKEKWQAQVGGTGLTQAIAGYGMVIVADGQGQRVVALDAETGATKWTFATGSRMHYSAALHKGVCLVATNSGWVYGLDARTGAPLWKLLAAPAERYIGSQERFESLWPIKGDVLVVDGVGYVGAGHAGTTDGGVQVVAFDPASGKPAWNKLYQEPVSTDLLVSIPGKTKALLMNGRALDLQTQKLGERCFKPAGCLHQSPTFGQTYASLDDYLTTTERNKTSERRERLGDGKVVGLFLAFDDKLHICVEKAKGAPALPTGEPPPQDFRLIATADGKTNLWEKTALGMRVDGLVLSPDALYCAGHSLTDEPGAEATLQVLAPATGDVLQTLKLKDVPVFDGLSAANGKLFLVTENGKVLCFESQ